MRALIGTSVVSDWMRKFDYDTANGQSADDHKYANPIYV